MALFVYALYKVCDSTMLMLYLNPSDVQLGNPVHLLYRLRHLMEQLRASQATIAYVAIVQATMAASLKDCT